MDPNTNLKEQLDLARLIVYTHDKGYKVPHETSDRLAELVIALDEWISNGGFLPERWKRKGE